MEQEVMIDIISVDDAEALLTYSQQVGAETEYLTFGAKGIDLTLEQEVLRIQSILEMDNQLMLVAKIDGRIIAVANISTSLREKLCHVGEVGISVLKEYWGQGLASALLGELLEWTKNYSNIVRLELEVVSDNERAIQLYQRFGFEKEATLKKAIKLSDGYHDVDKMVMFFEEE